MRCLRLRGCWEACACAAATAAAAALASLAAAAAASTAFAAGAPLMLVAGSLVLKLSPRLIVLGSAAAGAGGRQGCHAPVARRAASRLEATREDRKEASRGDAGVGRCCGSLILHRPRRGAGARCLNLSITCVQGGSQRIFSKCATTSRRARQQTSLPTTCELQVALGWRVIRLREAPAAACGCRSSPGRLGWHPACWPACSPRESGTRASRQLRPAHSFGTAAALCAWR